MRMILAAALLALTGCVRQLPEYCHKVGGHWMAVGRASYQSAICVSKDGRILGDDR